MHRYIPVLALCLLASSLRTIAQIHAGTVVNETIRSTALSKTLTGLDPNRTIKVYLPPGYKDSNKTYPVVYYFHSLNWSAEKMFHDGQVARLLDRAIAHGITPEFIMVAADYSSPSLGSWYENSPVTGHWIDFTIQELIPFIEGRYRVRKNRESRAAVGDFVGGRGALYFAMTYPDLFSIVYAMHPVATGTGYRPMISNADWNQIMNAKATAELTGFSIPYVAFHQAFLPNQQRPPFYCDFMVDMVDGEPRQNNARAEKLRSAFLLDYALAGRADALRSLHIAFDWARYDPNYDHVHANQQFTLKLEELGIEHEAEEYRGDPWSQNFTDHGRFYSRTLPWLGRWLK